VSLDHSEGRQVPQSLSSQQVSAIAKDGDYRVDRNLYLQVRDDGRTRSWVFRYRFRGRLRRMGLGSARLFTLSDIRKKALRTLRDDDTTVHGLRASFRTWCAEATDFPREIAEAALGHRVGDDVERAYARTTFLAKRRSLMEEWAVFTSGRDAP